MTTEFGGRTVISLCYRRTLSFHLQPLHLATEVQARCAFAFQSSNSWLSTDQTGIFMFQLSIYLSIYQAISFLLSDKYFFLNISDLFGKVTSSVKLRQFKKVGQFFLENCQSTWNSWMLYTAPHFKKEPLWYKSLNSSISMPAGSPHLSLSKKKFHQKFASEKRITNAFGALFCARS